MPHKKYFDCANYTNDDSPYWTGGNLGIAKKYF